MFRFLRFGALAAVAAGLLAIPYFRSSATIGTSVPVIVELRTDPAAVYAAKAQQTGATVSAEQLQSYRDGLAAAQDQFVAALKNQGIAAQVKTDSVPNTIGTTTPVQLRYTLTFDGIALTVPSTALSSISAMSQVKAVYPDSARQLQLEKSVNYIRAPEVYGRIAEITADFYKDPPSPPDPYEGQGMKVAVIDTGVDWSHPMFGGDPTPPRLGIEPDIAAANFNRKIIYYLPLVDGLVDDFGHGTHTSADIAGYQGFSPGPDGIPNNADDVPIHGVAPQARLMDYKVCNAAGTCLTSDILMAIDDAVSPRTVTGDSKPVANVINMSIGGIGSPDSAEAIAADNAALKGTIVVASAGNSGTGLGALGAPAAGRRVIAVAADNDPAVGNNTVDVSDGSRMGMNAFIMDGSAPVTADITQNYVFCGLGETPADFPSSVSGKIALIQRGSTASVSLPVVGGVGTGNFVNKVTLAAEAGAIAAVIFNNVDGELTSATVRKSLIPAFGLSKANGEYLLSIIGTSPGPSAQQIRINKALLFSPVMASFSSRGPVAGSGQIKPDVSAPGMNVLSATSMIGAPTVSMQSATRYIAASGTSFSGPHVAGSVALIKQAHADWSPDVIRTVLINTATNLRTANQTAKADGPDSADSIIAQGGGLVDVYRAVHAKAMMGITGDGITDPSILGSKSFGEVPVVNNRITSTQSVTVTVQDLSGQGGTYNLGVANNRDLQTNGINVSTNASTVTVPANGSATFTVNASFDGNLIRDRFINTAILNGSFVTLGNRAMELQWYVTAQSNDGSQSLRMPFYFKPVQSFPANPTIETTPLNGTILVGSTDSMAADPVDYTDVPFQVDDRTVKIQANLTYDDTVNGLDLLLVDPRPCDPTKFCENYVARVVPVKEGDQTKRQLNFVVDHPGTYIYRVSGNVAAAAQFKIESKLFKGGLAPAMQQVAGDFVNASGDHVDFDGSLNLQWTPQGGEQGFEIEQSTDNQNWDFLADVAAGTTTLSLNNLADGDHYFRVRGLTAGQIGQYVTAASDAMKVVVSARSKVDITSVVSYPLSNTSFTGGVWQQDNNLINNSTQAYVPKVEFNVIGISSPSVRVINADNGGPGTSPSNPAVFDFSQRLGSDQLFSVNETTGAKTLRFQDTAAVNFTFDVQITAYVTTGSSTSSSSSSSSSSQQSSAGGGGAGSVLSLPKVMAVRRFTVSPLTRTVTSQLISLN